MEELNEQDTLKSIYRMLDYLTYECSAREYTMDEDQMASIFACRDLAWLCVKKWDEREDG